jgi:hypothetical protein
MIAHHKPPSGFAPRSHQHHSRIISASAHIPLRSHHDPDVAKQGSVWSFLALLEKSALTPIPFLKTTLTPVLVVSFALGLSIHPAPT